MVDLDVSSRLTMLYGKYPFSNDPKMGKPRNFYDEVRTKDFPINEGDVVRIVREDKKADGINFCVGMSESTMKNCTARGTGVLQFKSVWTKETYQE